MKFRQRGRHVRFERFAAACRLVFIAQEILVDHASYPTRRIAANSHRFRPLGLGYSNLGSLIMASGLAYDSRASPRAVRRHYRAPARGGLPHQRRVGRSDGPLRGLRGEPGPMLRVMEMHREKVEEIDAVPPYLQDAARQIWDEVLGPRPPPWLPQRPGHGVGPHRHHQLHDGLRHHGDRARHRAGEVQATGRRRHAEDRQPDGPLGAADLGLQRGGDRRRSWPASTSTTRSKARRS